MTIKTDQDWQGLGEELQGFEETKNDNQVSIHINSSGMTALFQKQSGSKL